MAYDYQLIITSIVSAFAIGFSLYNFCQSIRRPEADLWIDEEDKPIVVLYIYNPGQRQIALIKFRYIINGEVSDIQEGIHANMNHTNPNATINTWFVKKEKFPYTLNGGDSEFIIIEAHALAGTLFSKGYSDKIKLSAYVETAQKKKIKTESLDFDINKYK